MRFRTLAGRRPLSLSRRPIGSSKLPKSRFSPGKHPPEDVHVRPGSELRCTTESARPSHWTRLLPPGFQFARAGSKGCGRAGALLRTRPKPRHDQFTEIEIVHPQNSLFVSGPFQNIGILSLLCPSIHEVYCAMALFSWPRHRFGRDAHVGQKLRRGIHLFFREPSSVLKGLPNVLKTGTGLYDFGGRRSIYRRCSAEMGGEKTRQDSLRQINLGPRGFHSRA
ncbi:hypothetical protein GGP99_003318 [Salinibacter ruber]|uniref:Uncharacterized protein n=1 Tax=Salinibacter ruber TaxID=146919 RepID=A0AAW5PDJ9_9BACT|nr:hypothetical protein [Salinibacter ruber]